MKKQLAFLLAVLLLGGCSAGAESSAGESASLLTGETVSGIITKVNGNEITLELVTLNQPAVPEEAGEKAGAPEERPQNPEEAPRGESQAPGGDSGLSGREDRGSAPGGGNRGERPSGEMPQGGSALRQDAPGRNAVLWRGKEQPAERLHPHRGDRPLPDPGGGGGTDPYRHQPGVQQPVHRPLGDHHLPGGRGHPGTGAGAPIAILKEAFFCGKHHPNERHQ